MIAYRLLVSASLAFISGCASIVNGQNQSISIATPGCAGAACELSNDKGRWFIGTTPGSVMVNRSYADLFVKCGKGDSAPAVQSVPSRTKGMAFGNILFGGIIGAGVDIANGSAYDYPNEISLPLSCDGKAAQAAGPVRLGCRVRELVEVSGGVPGYQGSIGVLVTVVDPESVAERIGLQAGDVLVEFNEVPITDSSILRERLGTEEAKQGFRIRYFRNGRFGIAELNNKGV